MPTVHSANTTALTTSRECSETRQSFGPGAGCGRAFFRVQGSLNPLPRSPPIVPPDVPLALTRSDDGLGGRRRRRDPLDDDGLIAAGRDEVQLLRRDVLDPPRRAQRFDLEAQMTVHFFFRRALLLQSLHLVAVAQQLH